MTVSTLSDPLTPRPQTQTTASGRTAPRLPTLNPLGHFVAFRRDSIGLFLRAHEYGEVVGMKIGPVDVHLVFDPAAARRVMVDNHTNYTKQTRGYDALRRLLGNGLVTSEGSFWRRQRRIAQPAFHRTRLANLAHIMQQAATDLASDWLAAADGKQRVDIANAMMRVTLRIAGETLFSVDLSDDSAELGGAVTDMLGYFDAVFTSLTPLGPFLPTPRIIRGRLGKRRLDKAVYRIIAERRAAPNSGMDLLGMMMDATDEDTGEQMSDLQLRDEVMTMLLAGHETTANALSWTLYLLSKHPAVLRTLQRELDEVLKGEPVQVSHLKELTYLDYTLKEGLRLYPPVWTLARQSVEDDVLAGYHIPANSYVLFSPYCIHRHPDHWQNPEGFDPERWSPERQRVREERGYSKHAYLPFAAGPRKCIGDHFAKMEAKIILATLLTGVEPELVSHHPVIPEASVTLRPRDGILMTLRKRQQPEAAATP